MKVLKYTLATDSKQVTLFIHSQFEFGDYLQDVEHGTTLCPSYDVIPMQGLPLTVANIVSQCSALLLFLE